MGHASPRAPGQKGPGCRSNLFRLLLKERTKRMVPIANLALDIEQLGHDFADALVRCEVLTQASEIGARNLYVVHTQYSSASMRVRTRRVTLGSAGSGEPYSMFSS